MGGGLLPQQAHTRSVPFIAAGADEVVEGQLQGVPQLGEAISVGPDERLHVDPSLMGGGDVLERVVVGTGQEADLLSSQTAVASKDVGLDKLERMPQVGCSVDVGDGCGDVEGTRAHGDRIRSPLPHSSTTRAPAQQGLVVSG